MTGAGGARAFASLFGRLFIPATPSAKSRGMKRRTAFHAIQIRIIGPAFRAA